MVLNTAVSIVILNVWRMPCLIVRYSLFFGRILTLTRKIIETCSARFFLSATHFPLPIVYTSLIEAVRIKNGDFLNDLQERLIGLVSPQEDSIESETEDSNQKQKKENQLPLRLSDVSEFIDGAFRNVSIQIHQGKGSHTRELTRHRGM